MATTIKLKFVDVLGQALDDHSVVVDIFSLDNTRHFQAVVPLNGQTDVAINLEDSPGGVYRFELSCANYRVMQFFLTLVPDGTTVRDKPVVFPVDPALVVDIVAPDFPALDSRLQKLLNQAKVPLNGIDVPAGAALYAALPAKIKAALLNLFTKSANTGLGDGGSCFDHLQILLEIDQDRLFAKTDAALVEEASTDNQFHSVDFSLHKEIAPYQLFASVKTLDSRGNLQLTFSRNGQVGNDYLADMDIDEAQGIAHVFEVAQNFLTHSLTSPYNVREILAVVQNLKPLYTFKFASRGKAKAVGAA
jgi:hypothetical protein